MSSFSKIGGIWCFKYFGCGIFDRNDFVYFFSWRMVIVKGIVEVDFG